MRREEDEHQRVSQARVRQGFSVVKHLSGEMNDQSTGDMQPFTEGARPADLGYDSDFERAPSIPQAILTRRLASFLKHVWAAFYVMHNL